MCPAMCTGRIARVRAEATARTASGVRHWRPGSTSAGTGTAPVFCTAREVLMKVNAGTITSSPGPMPCTRSASSRASVPLLTASA
ncbi:hypothetical protein SCALM49S_05924 [Streptomyces californicus]